MKESNLPPLQPGNVALPDSARGRMVPRVQRADSVNDVLEKAKVDSLAIRKNEIDKSREP